MLITHSDAVMWVGFSAAFMDHQTWHTKCSYDEFILGPKGQRSRSQRVNRSSARTPYIAAVAAYVSYAGFSCCNAPRTSFTASTCRWTLVFSRVRFLHSCRLFLRYYWNRRSFTDMVSCKADSSCSLTTANLVHTRFAKATMLTWDSRNRRSRGHLADVADVSSLLSAAAKKIN